MHFQVPSRTTINSEEFKPEEYVIPFVHELIKLILDKHKLTTYRYGMKYDYLKIGDTVKIQDSSSKIIVGKAKINNKSKSTFINLPLTNGTHESYRDKTRQREVLSGYYAYIGRPISDDDEFLVFDFKLID